jgi:hypothetical protein
MGLLLVFINVNKGALMTVKLNYAKLEIVDALIESGFERKQAETLVKILSNTEHDQLCTEQEIIEMLNSVAKDTITEMRREFDKRMEVSEKRFDDEIKEMRSHKRWIVGTIITVGIAIIGYLQFFH